MEYISVVDRTDVYSHDDCSRRRGLLVISGEMFHAMLCFTAVKYVKCGRTVRKNAKTPLRHRKSRNLRSRAYNTGLFTENMV